MSSQYLRIFQQPRSAILLILGFASGLPLALTSGTLQAWMTVENIDLKTIGFFSLVGQAYVFKFHPTPLDGGAGSGDRFLLCFPGYSLRCVENRCASGRRTWCGRGNQRAGLPFRDAGFRRPSPVAGR